MSINSISQSPFRPTTNNTNRRNAAKADNGFTQAAEKASTSTASSQPVNMDAFKQDIYKQLGAMQSCASTSVSIQISDSAFERMQSDPKFKAEMLDIIRRDLAGCQPPITSLMINIDENGYSGQSYNFGYGADKVEKHEEKSFYKRPATSKPKYDNGKVKSGDDQYSDWLQEQSLLQSDASRKVFKKLLANRDAKNRLF